MGGELSRCFDKVKSKFEDDEEKDKENVQDGEEYRDDVIIQNAEIVQLRSASRTQQNIRYAVIPLFTEAEEQTLSQDEKDEKYRAEHIKILIKRELMDFFVDEATERKIIQYHHGLTMRVLRQRMDEEIDEMMMTMMMTHEGHDESLQKRHEHHQGDKKDVDQQDQTEEVEAAVDEDEEEEHPDEQNEEAATTEQES